MKARRLFGLLLDLVLLATSLDDGTEIRMVGVVLVAVVGAVVIFAAAVLALGVLAQREPPYQL
jgi:hypothetical protein